MLFRSKSPKILTFYKNASNMGVRSNGVVIVNTNGATGSIPAGISQTFYLGEGFRGKISEFILFNRFLNTEETQAIEQYLAKKWAIKIS